MIDTADLVPDWYKQTGIPSTGSLPFTKTRSDDGLEKKKARKEERRTPLAGVVTQHITTRAATTTLHTVPMDNFVKLDDAMRTAGWAALRDGENQEEKKTHVVGAEEEKGFFHVEPQSADMKLEAHSLSTNDVARGGGAGRRYPLLATLHVTALRGNGRHSGGGGGLVGTAVTATNRGGLLTSCSLNNTTPISLVISNNSTAATGSHQHQQQATPASATGGDILRSQSWLKQEHHPLPPVVGFNASDPIIAAMVEHDDDAVKHEEEQLLYTASDQDLLPQPPQRPPSASSTINATPLPMVLGSAANNNASSTKKALLPSTPVDQQGTLRNKNGTVATTVDGQRPGSSAGSPALL